MNFNYTSNLSKFQLHLIFKEFAAQVKFENEETKKKSNWERFIYTQNELKSNQPGGSDWC